MAVPLLIIVPAIKLIAAGVALGAIAYQLGKTYEGAAIKKWFEIGIEAKNPNMSENLEEYLKKYFKLDIEIILSVLIQMQAIIDNEKFVIKDYPDVLKLTNKAFSKSVIKYDRVKQQNIKAVILDIYKTITPGVDGKLYNYLRGGLTSTEQQLKYVKSGISSGVEIFNVKKYLIYGGIAAGSYLFIRYALPKIIKKRKES